MNKRVLSRLLGGAVFAAALGWASSGAWAGQDVTVPSGLASVFPVCGNGNAGGGAPCDNVPTGNTVTVDGGVLGDVSGAQNTADGTDVTGNKVTVNGSVTGTVYGGYHMPPASIPAVADSNTVTVNSGSEVDGGVYGGWAHSLLSTSDASSNTVEINGGTISGSIVGGYADFLGNVGHGSATGNTVTIQGSPTFTNVDALDGGRAGASSGNTLNLHVTGLTVGDLAFFQTLNFFLPTGLNNGGTMLNTTTAELPALPGGAVVNVSLEGAGPALSLGNSYNLIASGVTGDIDPASATGVVGGFNYTLAVTDGKLVLTLGSPVIKPAAAAAAIPALDAPALAALALLLAGMAWAGLRRRG